MFSVIYVFDVKSGRDEEFRKAWREFTEVIYEHAGSLGSRLHRQRKSEYVAYAQWPDRKTWEMSASKLPESSSNIRKRMRGACNKIEIVYELDVVENLLKTTSAS